MKGIDCYNWIREISGIVLLFIHNKYFEFHESIFKKYWKLYEKVTISNDDFPTPLLRFPSIVFLIRISLISRRNYSIYQFNKWEMKCSIYMCIYKYVRFSRLWRIIHPLNFTPHHPSESTLFTFRHLKENIYNIDLLLYANGEFW